VTVGLICFCVQVCHSGLNRNYTSSMTMLDMFGHVFGLLLAPEPEDPLNVVMALEYRKNYARFVDRAREATARFASKPLSAWKEELLADGSVSAREMDCDPCCSSDDE
jgi:hypothetical protein